MNRDFNFFKTNKPESRPADYHIGCLDGSVFLDFNTDQNGQIYLKRISFDGYGCCELNDTKSKALSRTDSKLFLDIIALDNLDQFETNKLVHKSLVDNIDLIWTDALVEYGFQ